MNPCIYKSVLRLVCGCLSLGLLILMTGCTKKNPHSVAHEEVSGKVLIVGKPLPGGRVTFSAVNGTFATTGVIDENGNYQIKAPIGDVKISVDNRMLGRRKAAPQAAKQHPLPPGREAKEEENVKGRYVQIPYQYSDIATSGLTYTVQKGPQTHDIELSAKSATAPGGAPGQ